MKISAGGLCVLRDIKSGMCTRIILMVVSFNCVYAVYNDGMVYPWWIFASRLPTIRQSEERPVERPCES